LALILGLLLFGRQIRERFGSVAVGAPAAPSRRQDDGSAAQPVVEDTPAPQPVVEDTPAAQPVDSDLDYELHDDTLNLQSITLDADFDDGTGLHATAETDVSQDLGFLTAGASADHKLDIEVIEHTAKEEDHAATDIIPPIEQQNESILENEILPSDEGATADYDISMMIDATKQILPDDLETAKDLMAVALDEGGDTKSDYKILEQDYENELTATHVFNLEIEEAARALAEQRDGIDAGGGDTTEMPMSEAPETTAEMPKSEAPEITAEMPVSENSETAAELTAELPASGDAQNEDFDDSSVIIPELTVETAETPLPDSAATIEVESGSIDTKKSKAS
jgi:hypothetical protein